MWRKSNNSEDEYTKVENCKKKKFLGKEKRERRRKNDQ
jgi:hypothetical protein